MIQNNNSNSWKQFSLKVSLAAWRFPTAAPWSALSSPHCWYFSVSLSHLGPSSCLLSACLVLTTLALEMCLEKWWQFETATADSYSHIKLQPFPELTVCPANPYKVETLKAHGISEARDIQFGAGWISNDSDIRLRLRKFSPPKSHHAILSGQTNFTRVFCTKSRSWWRTSMLI